MRLGSQPCQLTLGTKAAELYGSFVINTNAIAIATNSTTPTAAKNSKRPDLLSAAIRPTANSSKVIELRDHPFFVASQFHPEFPEQAAPAASALQGIHSRRAPEHPSQAAGRKIFHL